ncbi:MAG: ribonuclease E inhibitor RraB, partial [Sphingobium sp.]
MSVKLPKVDPARLEEEWEADKEVLASLAENGDRAEIPRLVDVSFRGTDEQFDRVLEIAILFGMVELDRETDEEGDLYLF